MSKQTERTLAAIAIVWLAALLVTSFIAFVFPGSELQPYMERSAIFLGAAGLVMLFFTGVIYEEMQKEKKADEVEKKPAEAGANSDKPNAGRDSG